MFTGQPSDLKNAIAQIISEECHCTTAWERDERTGGARGPVTLRELAAIKLRICNELFSSGPVAQADDARKGALDNDAGEHDLGNPVG